MLLNAANFLGSGTDRAAFFLPPNFCCKIPQFLVDKNEFFPGNSQFFRSLEIGKELFHKNPPEFENLGGHEYFQYLQQSLNEVFVWENTKSKILLPLIHYSWEENGLFYSIFPKIDRIGDFNSLIREEEKEEFMEEVEILENLGIDLCDGLDNAGNCGIYNGKVVILDYGLSSSSFMDREESFLV